MLRAVPALDQPDMQRRVGRVEQRVGAGPLGRKPVRLGLLLEPGHQPRRVEDRRDAGVDYGRVHLEAADMRVEHQAALVAGHHLHVRRLADDDAGGRRHGPGQRRHQPLGAPHPDLLVIGERDLDRPLQPRLQCLRHRRQRDRRKALHVARAAAVEPPVLLRQRERVGAPRLPVDRHDVRMRRQHDAARLGRPDQRVEVRLGALVVHHPVARDAVAAEVVLDEVDQRQVRLARDGREGDETLQHLAR